MCGGAGLFDLLFGLLWIAAAVSAFLFPAALIVFVPAVWLSLCLVLLRWRRQ
jgi:hypothetical protein